MNSIRPRVGEISVINNYQSHLIAIRRGSWITTLGVSEDERTQAWSAEDELVTRMDGMPDQSAGRGGMRIQLCQSESMTLVKMG